MHWRPPVVALVVILAGCSGAVPTSSTEDVETLTPAPVPEDLDPETGVPGVEDGRIDGAPLGAAHADSIAGAHTRVVHFHVSAGDGVYLDFRETRTVGSSNESLRTRSYEGPGTARFVPGEADATTARSERFASGGAVGQRRTVDGRTERIRTSGPEPPASPVPELDDAALVAGLLENASVAGRTPGGDVQLVGDAVAPAVVPKYLDTPRRVTVRATVRGDGHVPHVTVSYLGSLEGENVSVTLDVYWLSRTDPVVVPGWYEGETDRER